MTSVLAQHSQLPRTCLPGLQQTPQQLFLAWHRERARVSWKVAMVGAGWSAAAARGTDGCCTRRSRDAACRPRMRGRAAPKAPPRAIAPTTGRPAFEHHLARVLAGDAASLDRLAALYASYGWQPPAPARRDGGLWLLSASAIKSLPPPPAARPDIQYGEPWFAHMFARSADGMRLPHIECRRPHAVR